MTGFVKYRINEFDIRTDWKILRSMNYRYRFLIKYGTGPSLYAPVINEKRIVYIFYVSL